MALKLKAQFARGLQSNPCRLLILLAVVFGLQGCINIPNIITDMSFSQRSMRPGTACDCSDANECRRCTPELRESLLFAEIGKEIAVFPAGQGTCALASVDFGDGTPPSTFLNRAVDHNSSWRAPHTYSGWPGKKLVRVKGESGCLGDVTKEITVGIGSNGREEFRSSFAPNNMVCNVVLMNPSPRRVMPPIRKGTGVRIETDGRKFNYGGSNSFDASGDASSPTPLGYLFPGHRKFSLVYRIGSQTVQGEAGPVVFVANQTGSLEVCVNDNPNYLTDNTGLMLITITVNERSAL